MCFQAEDYTQLVVWGSDSDGWCSWLGKDSELKLLFWKASTCVFQTVSWPIPTSCVIVLNLSPDSSAATGFSLMASDSSFHLTAASALLPAEADAGQASPKMLRKPTKGAKRAIISHGFYWLQNACVRTDDNQVYTTFQTHLSRPAATTSVSSPTCGGRQASRLALCTDHSGCC